MVLFEVAGDRADPPLVRPGGAARSLHSQPGREGAGEALDVAGAHGQAVVGLGARVGDRRLDRVQAVHLRPPRVRRGGPHAPPSHEVGDITEVAGATGQEIGVEREDNVGVAEVVAGVDVRAEGLHRAAVGGVVAERLVLVPLRVGQGAEQVRELLPQRRRDDGLRQDTQAGPAARVLPLPFQGPAEGSEALVPGARLAEVRDGLGAVGVVEAEDGRLVERVGGAEAGGVLGVALDLRRPTHVALDQEADA